MVTKERRKYLNYLFGFAEERNRNYRKFHKTAYKQLTGVTKPTILELPNKSVDSISHLWDDAEGTVAVAASSREDAAQVSQLGNRERTNAHGEACFAHAQNSRPREITENRPSIMPKISVLDGFESR